MDKQSRTYFENLAIDLVLLSMEYMDNEDRIKAYEEVKTLSDSQLVDFVLDQ